MADENKEVDWSATVAIELKERISELERLMKTTRTVFNDQQKEIAELERDVRRLQTEYPYTTAKENSRQLNELKGMIADTNQLSNRVDLVLGVQTQIDELKEMLNVVAQARIGWEETIDSTLRQLFKKREECEDSTIHRSFYAGLLEKLDSGGEKEGSAKHTQPYSNLSEVKPIGNQSENSKPPEPNLGPHPNLNYFGEKINLVPEPRENDIKAMDRQIQVEMGTHIFVKREKIEFWRTEMLNKTDEVLKSMREVLGIE